MQQRPHRADNGHLNSPFNQRPFFYPRYRPDGLDRERLNGLQSSLERMKGEQWASIQDLTIVASPQLAKLEDNLAFTVGFKLQGGIRRNFVRPLWEKAYDEHDLESEWPTESTSPNRERKSCR